MIIIEGLDYPTLTVSDLEFSIQFYEDNFDFEVVHKDPETGKVYLRVNDILIGLVEQKEFKAPAIQKNRLTFNIDPEDFADALAEIEANNLPVVEKNINQRRGESVVIRDPDGYQIEISYPRTKF